MKRQEWIELLHRAVQNFADSTLGEVDGEDVQTINDEFMLELYDVTGDGRAP